MACCRSFRSKPRNLRGAPLSEPKQCSKTANPRRFHQPWELLLVTSKSMTPAALAVFVALLGTLKAAAPVAALKSKIVFAVPLKVWVE